LTKPLTVQQALQNLIDASKPKPLEVVIARPKLSTPLDFIKYWLAVGVLLQIRTAIVWGFLALFFPQLGVTWFMVMFGLWAIRHVVPPKVSDVIRNVTKAK
jgi:hypothetical protein